MTAEQLIQKMAERGLRITEQRRSLAQLFVDTEGYLLPKDVYEHLEKIYPGLSFDTVYRNLKLMEQLSLIEPFNFEDGVKFRLHCQEHDHHHHLVCMQCETVVPLVYCPLDHAAIPEQFEVVSHRFEVQGFCRDCQSS